MLRFGRDSRSPQPWLRPPRLRTLADVDAEEERHASWLELFFDLVFCHEGFGLFDGSTISG